MGERTLRLDEFVPYRLSFTSNLVSETVASAYEALFGLTIPEWRLVAVVAETDGVTQQEIGRRTHMDKVTVSRAAAALVSRGLLAREAKAEDKRSHLLRLTAAGAQLHAAVSPKALELEARVFAAFRPEEVAEFVSMLRRIDAVTLAMRDGGAAGE